MSITTSTRGVLSGKVLDPVDELFTQIALAPPSKVSHDSQEDKSRVASFLPI